MSKMTDILIDDMINECNVEIEKWTKCMDNASDAVNRSLYKGKIEAYSEIRKSLLKRKSHLG